VGNFIEFLLYYLVFVPLSFYFILLKTLLYTVDICQLYSLADVAWLCNQRVTNGDTNANTNPPHAHALMLMLMLMLMLILMLMLMLMGDVSFMGPPS